MCKSISQGGERCAAHTREDLAKAQSKAKENPSVENNVALKRAMGAYDRTATGTQELRAKGTPDAVARADRYDAERKAKKAGRQEAKHLIAQHEEIEKFLYNRLYDSELNGVGRYDENFSGLVLQDVKVENYRLADGRIPVSFKYEAATSHDEDYGLLDGGLINLDSFKDPETLDETCTEYADGANESVNWNDDEGKGSERARNEALTEQFGDNWENIADVSVRVMPPYDAEKVQEYASQWIENLDLDSLSDRDLSAVDDHPLASSEKRQAACELLDWRNGD